MNDKTVHIVGFSGGIDSQACAFSTNEQRGNMSVLKHLVMCVCPWSSYQEEPVTRYPAGNSGAPIA